MTANEILTRWAAIERGDGLVKCQKISRVLTIIGVAGCIAIVAGTMWLGWVAGAFGIAGILIGWVIAERNALDTRVADWPTYRQYIDWPRVHQDLATNDPVHK